MRGNLLPNTEFGHLNIGGDDAECRVSDAARQKEELSWKQYAKRLNRYLLEMEKLFWPDLFIVGGGISKQSEKYLPLLEIQTPIITAQFLNQAGIVGAALAARQGVNCASINYFQKRSLLRFFAFSNTLPHGFQKIIVHQHESLSVTRQVVICLVYNLPRNGYQNSARP